MFKVAINGLGRIGRATLKIVLDNPELELVAVNDLVPPDNLAYLLKYDTVYGKYEKSVEVEGNSLLIGGKKIPVFSSKDPSELPWGKLGVDTVFECTGKLTGKADMQKHINAGAKSVILSTTSKEEEVGTVVVGVNTVDPNSKLISCASCTTNCITPVVEIMGRRIGIEKAILTTVHSYTSTQSIVDSPSKKFRRGRAGAMNLVPTSTGAAIATTRALPQYKGKFDGVAVRAPVADGSLSDITFITSRPTTVEEIRNIFREEASSPRYKNIIGVSEDPLVSSDIIKDPHASVVDLELVQVVDGNLVKIMSWYDNEWGYASQMVREAENLSKSRK
jgi:glyceraldehyde 3-phosphate dehydrogenase